MLNRLGAYDPGMVSELVGLSRPRTGRKVFGGLLVLSVLYGAIWYSCFKGLAGDEPVEGQGRNPSQGQVEQMVLDAE